MNKRTFGKRGLAIFAAASLVLTLAATVLADAPNPDTAVNVQVNGLTVTIDGTWQWTRNCDAGVIAAASDTDFRDVGVAVDWSDPSAAGNEVVPGLDVGTPTDNVIHQRDAALVGTCSGTTDSSGSWGPISHTYAQAGTYEVCAVMYDIRLINTPADGRGSKVAGGAAHNEDNSAEENSFESGVQCVSTSIVVVNPPPSAESSVLAGTGTPAASQPDTAQSREGVNPITTIGFSLLLLASLATLAYANVKTVRNRN